jgi:hypothetical protein
MNVQVILYYLLLFVLAGIMLYGLCIGLLFFFKRSGEKRANVFFGLLIIAFSLTLLHNIFLFLDFYDHDPQWKFLPVYYTLAFPPLLFYYVKLNCYPSYVLRWTDIKHSILPVSQFLFFLFMFLSPVSFKSRYDRLFYNPFYGAFEQFLYLTTFFSYLYFAYRYVIQRRREIRRKKEFNRWEVKRIIYLEKLLQILFFLFCIHTAFVIADFVSYEFFNINLRAFRPYAALGALSFAALILWLSIYGSQVLIWGRRVFKT